MSARLSPAQREAAREAYVDKGLTVTQLAQAYGVAYSVMQRALADVSRPAGGKVRATLTTAQMVKLRDDGLTYLEIAKQAGISESAAWRRVNGETMVSS